MIKTKSEMMTAETQALVAVVSEKTPCTKLDGIPLKITKSLPKINVNYMFIT